MPSILRQHTVLVFVDCHISKKTRSFAVYMWYSGRRKPVADSFLVYSRPTLGITFHAKEMLYSKPSNPFPAFISLANVNGYILGSLRMSSLASSRSSMILFQSTISLCGDVLRGVLGHHVYVELLGVPGELWAQVGVQLDVELGLSMRRGHKGATDTV